MPPYQVIPKSEYIQALIDKLIDCLKDHYEAYVIEWIQKHIPKGVLICTVYTCGAWFCNKACIDMT